MKKQLHLAQAQDSFQVNKEFAKKYEYRENRKLLEKQKNQAMELDEEDSEVSSEDSNGDMINEEFYGKFITQLAKIKTKQKEIYEEDKVLFKEEDLNIDKTGVVHKEKSLTYKDQVRQNILEQNADDQLSDSEEFELKRKNIETPYQEEQRIKNEFKQAVTQFEKAKLGEDDFLQKKEKSAKQIEKEEKIFTEFLKRNEQLSKNKDDTKLLEQFWGEKAELSEKDAFLRKFILEKGWIEKDVGVGRQTAIDEEDSEREEEMDGYEKKYNFRYEEEGADQVQTYDRHQTDTMRIENTKRRDKRDEKKLRMQEESQRHERQQAQLKQAKRQEILQRIRRIQQVGDQTKANDVYMEQFLEEDYDEHKFDALVQQQYDSDYYAQSDEDKQQLKGEIKDFQEQQDGQDKGKAIENDKEIMLTANLPVGMKKNMSKAESEQVQQQCTLWWYCDVCQRGLKENELRYDCEECEDYTVCVECQQQEQHPDHKMKRLKVPQGCSAPDQKTVVSLVSQFKHCQGCRIKLGQADSHFQHKKKNTLVMCEDCFRGLDDKKAKRYEWVDAQAEEAMHLLENNPDQLKNRDKQLDELVDQYYALDFEDLVQGQKTRFKYTQVSKQDYGLTDEDILFGDDKLINQYISLKKISPYIQNEQAIRVSKNKLPAIQNNAKINRKRFKKEMKVLAKAEDKIKEIEQEGSKNKNKKIKSVQRMAEILTKEIKGGKTKVEPAVELEVERQEEEEYGRVQKKVKEDRLKAYGL